MKANGSCAGVRIVGLFLLYLFCFFGGCTKGIPVKTEAEPDPRWLNLLADGDRSFQRRHYLGWLKAEAFYARAMEMGETPELRRRRAFNLGLLILRKSLLHVQFREDAENYLNLENELNRPIDNCLRWLVGTGCRLIQSGKADVHGTPEERQERMNGMLRGMLDEPIIEIDTFADDCEIYIYYEYCTRRYLKMEDIREQQKKLNDLMMQRHPESPLRLYTRLSNLGSFSQFFEPDADYLEPRVYQAQLFLETGRRSAAEKLFRYVLERNGDIPQVYHGLGLIHLAWEKYADAMGYFQQVLLRREDDHEAIFGLGAAQMYAGMYEDSLSTFSLIIERQLLYVGEARYYRALNLFNLNRRNEALEEIEQARSFIEDLPDLWELEGTIHYFDDRLEKSRSCFETGCALSKQKGSRTPEPDFYLGLIAFKQKRYPEAFNHFDRSLLDHLTGVSMQLAELSRFEDSEDTERELLLKRKKLGRSLKQGLERYKVVAPLLRKCPKRNLRRQIEGWGRQMTEMEAEYVNITESDDCLK